MAKRWLLQWPLHWKTDVGWLTGANKYLIRKSSIWSGPGWGSKVTSWIPLSPWWSTVLRPAGAVDSAVSNACGVFSHFAQRTHRRTHKHIHFETSHPSQIKWGEGDFAISHLQRLFRVHIFRPNYHSRANAVGCIALGAVQLERKLRKHPELRWFQLLEDNRRSFNLVMSKKKTPLKETIDLKATVTRTQV